MTEIPTLSGLPFLGNVHDIDSTDTHASYTRISNVYGEIFRYHTVGQSVVVVNSHDVLDGVCDERYYEKRPNQGALWQMRNGMGDGLFTSFNDEEAWGVAHRALMPKFGPLSVREMFGEMHDISCQMLSKWARLGPTHPIDPTDDFTRLTLDTIALSAMDSRFNSFYREKSHPFVTALVFFMAESGRRQFRPQFVNDYVYRASTKKYWQCIEIMRNIALQAIKERSDNPSDKNDLLNAMMKGKDPKTGKGMTEESIVNNAITFLLAGHETTSGMLSFFFVLLNSNPKAYKKAQEEVDTVIGEAQITVEHLSKLPYITACLRETVRLWPSAPGSRVSPKSQNDADYPLFLGKKQYKINKDDVVQWNMLKVHRDPLVYGEDADQFIPERMLDENFNKLPRNSWKAFGNGMRGCIGRDFAWQEGMLNIAMILQNFDLQSTDPSYTMRVRQTVTLKPIGYTMTARLRRDMNPTDLDEHLYGGQEVKKRRRQSQDKKIEDAGDLKKTPMTVLYGSNAGTCESLANALANIASSHGFMPKIMPMDSAANKLPTDQPVIVVTSSYEGQPPDNASRFVEWLQSLKGSELEGVRFGVFGCGNHDWATTFHRIPKLVDSLLEEHGGHRLTDAGLSDVAGGHVFDDFDHWQDDRLLPSLAKAFGGGMKDSIKSHGLDIKFHPTSRTTDLRQDVSEAMVLDNDILTSPDSPAKKHLSLQLPTHMTYSPGDYLAVLPMNSPDIVRHIMARFGLAWDETLLIPNSTQHTSLPQERPMSAFDLLSAYVELNTLATQKNVSTITSYADDEADRSALEGLTPQIISAKHHTPFSLLMAHPAIQLPFGDFLAMLPPLRVRQYSISSSPNHSPHTCTLTYAVLSSPSLSDPAHQYHGTASTYLSELSAGDRVHVSVRPSHASFHLPLDVENIPVIMICAGTGIAPFRGFCQFRHEQIVAGRKLAPAVLFVGCRHPDRDSLHTSDLEKWARDGAVSVRAAYSTAPERSDGCKHVQDRVWKDREEISELWSKGGKVFVCGSSGVAEGVGAVLKRCWIEGKPEGEEGERDEKGAEEWWRGVRNERFASDVFD